MVSRPSPSAGQLGLPGIGCSVEMKGKPVVRPLFNP